MQDTVVAILIFVYGLLAGSFLNVCIYRIPLERTVVQGRSHCPACGALIPWYLNIPVLSYIFLRGRCKECDAPISPIYPAVEMLNAILWVACYSIYGPTVFAVLLGALCSVFIVLAFIDFKFQIIPDRLIVIIFLLGAVNGVYQTVALGAPWQLWVVGFFAASLPLLLMGLVYEDGIGGGDIKLMAAAGLFAGWKLILLALFLGALYGLFYALGLYLAGKAVRRTPIPFGPFLCLGIVTSILTGDAMISWYLSLF
jgi:leader peptidase (prepilin peptidase) / N-methyltransferase